MINISQLYKSYGCNEVLKGISFTVKKGEIVGVLGRNGAGKTTLMRILTTYLPASKGHVRIAGLDALDNVMAVRRKIGYLPETPPLYENMSVLEYLRFAARLKDVPPGKVKARVNAVLDQCQLAGVKNKMINQLSKGFRQRIGIGQAIIHEPELLILDEPTNGLDPVQIQQVRNLIKNQEQERTVVLSTHILSEIEHLAQRVIIIREGEIVVDQPITDLLQSYSQKLSLEEIFLEIHKGRVG